MWRCGKRGWLKVFVAVAGFTLVAGWDLVGQTAEPVPLNAPAPGNENPIEEQPNGTWVRDIAFNDFLQIIGERLGLQYFANPELKDLKISGFLKTESLAALRAIALPYGVDVRETEGTLCALTPGQMWFLPREQFAYSLQYLRGRTREEQERLIELIRPAMSESGAIRYEEKTSTLVLLDHPGAIVAVKALLARIDVPKRQVVVDVKILRMYGNRARRTGVDWSQTLGATGLSLGATAVGPLNEIFNTVPVFGSAVNVAEQAAAVVGPAGAAGTESVTVQGGSTNAGIILAPLQVQAVLRMLSENDLARQESGPAVITEDNEQAIFRVVDRIPIVEQTVTQSDGVNNISTDVRYRIDPDDPIDPADSREVGVSITVTPTLLPDRTIRMRLFPRVATVTSYVRVATGADNIFNEYPRVNETSVEAIARIPDGFSLLLGGYYQNEVRELDNKVPILGDLPGIRFAFRSKQREKLRGSVCFVITPTAYEPTAARTVEVTEMLRQREEAPPHYEYADDDAPRDDARPNFLQQLRNLNPFARRESVEPLPTSRSEADADSSPKVRTRQEMEQRRLRATLPGHP